MESAILESLLNFGIFPCVTLYLVFIIIRDFKEQIKSLKQTSDEEIKLFTIEFNNMNNSLSKILDNTEEIQQYLNNYLNNIFIKLLDVFDDLDKK